jgi:hypothetical protein
MFPKPMTLLDLPNELLSQCFRHLKHDGDFSGWISPESKLDIQNVRLVSRRCNAVSAPLLISSTQVNISSASLSHFEELSRHHIFSKSIKQVEINVSYYDACLAKDPHLFAKHSSNELLRTLSSIESESLYTDEEVGFRDAYQALEEWEAIEEGLPGSEVEDLTPYQLLLIKAHTNYCGLFHDQKAAKNKGAHIKRTCAAFEKLLALDSIILNDNHHLRQQRGQSRYHFEQGFSDEQLSEQCVRPSTWKGSLMTSFVTTPPVEIIPELFTAMARTTTRPLHFSIHMHPPTDLRCMALNSKEQQDIKTVLQQSRHVSIDFESWSRGRSSNNRLRDEMLALCSLTKPLFDGPKLETLAASLGEYSVHYILPAISLAGIIPLTNEHHWHNLTTLKLRCIPLHLCSLQSLVTMLRERLKVFDIYCVHLLDGSWATALDIMRDFANLSSFSIHYMTGAEFGEPIDDYPDVPYSEIIEYVMRLKEMNPLLEYIASPYI